MLNKQAMNLDSSLLIQIVNARSQDTLKALDPSWAVKKKAVIFLDESYHNIHLLEKIDPSHFDSIYDTYPKKDILFIQNALKKNEHSFLKDFLIKDCFEKLMKVMPCMPYKYMPAFQGSKALFLNSHNLKQLILLLGMYDLKQALKTLIDQSIIKDITRSLSELQKLFLKELAKEKDKVAFKRLPLETWDRQKSSLEALLYLRGLNRFSKAFSDSDLFVKNELILRLPVKDKQQFLTLSSKIEPSIKEALCEEINHSIDFMKKNLNINF
jgi:hypothetical protein